MPNSILLIILILMNISSNSDYIFIDLKRVFCRLIPILMTSRFQL